LQQEYDDVLVRYRKLTSDAAQEPGAAPK
jgi:hypothetical protein